MVQMMSENVFVKIEEYKDVIDTMELIKTKIAEARVSLGKINDLKNQEDSELDLWKTSLDDIERRVNFVDKELFQA